MVQAASPAKTAELALVPDPAAGQVLLRPVERRRDWRAFHRLPQHLQAADPCFVPPLLLEQRLHLDPRSNPHFQDAEAAFWLAWRGGRVVGRIGAQVDRVALAHCSAPTGHFGHFEAEDDASTAAALFGEAEQWLRVRGMERVAGPYELSINDRCGLLVEGFDTPPMFMMGHAPPYYAKRIEAAGYAKARDLLAYHAPVGPHLPEQGQRLMARLGGAGVTLRAIDWADYRHEIGTMIDIFNDAWGANWGFVPFTGVRLDHLARSLKPILHADLVVIAEVDGEPAAMMVALLNLNEAVADLNGRLLPFGWSKLLWRLKFGRIGTLRVPLMGVRRRYQKSLLGAAMMMGMFDRVRAAAYARGVREAELSWVLEENRPMRHVAEHMGARAYKRYRIYEKTL